ncbi:MAG: C25 family cysteine peptidase [Nanoarchaeota archaeon]
MAVHKKHFLLFLFIIVILLLSTIAAAGFWQDVTGNIVKISSLKNALKKANVAQQTSSVLPPSETDIAINNRKRSDRYSARQAFVISDKDWHNVLSLVPAAMWYEGSELKKYPVLIYHEEDSGFDADSVLFFLKQYNAKKVVLVGDTPEDLDNLLIAEGYTYLVEVEAAMPSLSPLTGGVITEIPPVRREDLTPPLRGIDLMPDWLTRISPEDYTRYWSSYNTVIVCEDNYQFGLLASVYAAYINAPLFFEGRIPADIDLSGKRIITVGRTSYTGVERYNIEQLERRLLELYPTDKIILTNPNDLTIRLTKEIPQPYTTLLNGAQIEETYSKTSLSAPFLAVGKNEFILTTGNTEVTAIKADITAKITRYSLNPKYLTIMASPPAIQMERFSDDWDWYEEVDNHIYGDIDSDGFQDLAVGRIFTLTPSDVSAYVARDLFIEYIGKSNNFASLWPNYFSDMKVEGKSADREMRSAGYNDNSVYLDGSVRGLNAERDLKNKAYIAYLDHGNYAGWGGGIYTYDLRANYTKMYPSIVLSNACLTCAYTATYSYANTNDLFCSNIIKHGAMAHIGAVASTGGAVAFSQVIVDELLHGKDIGQAFLRFRKINEINYRLYSLAFGTTESTYNPHYILLGDPTLNIIPLSPTVMEDTQIGIENLGNMQKVNIRFNQPSEEVNYILIPDEEGFGGYEHYLVYPAGNVHVNGQRMINFQYEPHPPVMRNLLKDDLYWEMNGTYRITGINFKIKYSDGSERILPLNKRGDFYYYEHSYGGSFYDAYLLPLQVNGGYKIMMVYMETLELNKIMPSYEYEIEMQTSDLLSTIRTSVEAAPI